MSLMRLPGTSPYENGYNAALNDFGFLQEERIARLERELRDAKHMVVAIVWSAPEHKVTVTGAALSVRPDVYELERGGDPTVDAITYRARRI